MTTICLAATDQELSVAHKSKIASGDEKSFLLPEYFRGKRELLLK